VKCNSRVGMFFKSSGYKSMKPLREEGLCAKSLFIVFSIHRLSLQPAQMLLQQTSTPHAFVTSPGIMDNG
jgi:hypothetical protein